MPSQAHSRTIPLAPLRFAAVWILYLFMRSLAKLPMPWQLRICRTAGDLLRRVARRRRRVVATNLKLCFPRKPEPERERLVREHFRALGASVAEMAMAWYGPLDAIRRAVTVQGIENLERALSRGRGVILFSGHFTSFEIFFPILAPLCPRLCGMYKLQRNPIMNDIMTAGRGRNFDVLFANEGVRDMLRELARNSVVWYASDQSFAQKGGSLVPFFGEPAMTNTAISRIARISGAAVLPYFPRRQGYGPDYRLTIGSPLVDFPTEDEVEDTRRLIASMEDFIRECPEQYWWIHQRFKSRPPPLPDVYASADEPA